MSQIAERFFVLTEQKNSHGKVVQQSLRSKNNEELYSIKWVEKSSERQERLYYQDLYFYKYISDLNIQGNY